MRNQGPLKTSYDFPPRSFVSGLEVDTAALRLILILIVSNLLCMLRYSKGVN